MRLWAVAGAALHHAEHQEPGWHARVDGARSAPRPRPAPAADRMWCSYLAPGSAQASILHGGCAPLHVTGTRRRRCHGAAEVLRSQPYNEKCDVYSYGVIL